MFEGLFEVVWKSTAFFTAVFFAILLIVYLYQNKLLYLPDSPNRYPKDNTTGIREPGEAELEYEDVTIKTKDGIKLHGWFIKMHDPKHYPTFLYFHENAGSNSFLSIKSKLLDIGSRIPFIRFLQAYCNVNVLLVAYRGYSYSEGIPTERGLQIDALAVLDHIFSRSDINTDKIFVFGRSLGGAVSIYGLSHSDHQPAGLIIENTFTSISDMVDIVFAKLAKIKRLVLNNHWHSIRNIRSLKIPIMFIMGLKDELIPTTQMQQLYQAAEKSYFKEKYEVHSGTHNDTWSRDVEDYFEQLNMFIDKCLKHGPQNSYI